MLIALVPFEGREPPRQVSDELAQAVWCAVTSLWHPALLSSCRGIAPNRADRISIATGAREIRVIAGGLWDQLPSGYRTQAEDARSVLLESGTDRACIVAEIRGPDGSGDDADLLVESEGMTSSARDFLAFGTVRWMLRDLTIAMGHSDSIDYESLTRELLAGAHQWRIDDWSSAVNRLRAAFENLTQARERYYPVDAYLIDLCLIDPAMKEEVLASRARAVRLPISFLMPAQAIENQALHDPQRVAALRQAIDDGWADVAGGTYAEMEDALLPLESILWQFRRGSELYRLHLDDRTSKLMHDGDLACTRAFHRLPSDLDFGMRCTWASTRESFRSPPRPSVYGKARMAVAWKA